MQKSWKRANIRQMLWEKYRKEHPDGLGLSQFKQNYAQWKMKVNPTTHTEQKAGDEMPVSPALSELVMI